VTRLSVSDADFRSLGAAPHRQALFHLYLIRRFEERLLALKDAGLIHGPVHSSIGQEAVAVGAALALGRADTVASTHRGHHHFLSKALRAYAGDGYDPADGIPEAVFEVTRKTMAEIMGLASGWCRGRGGSMHLADLESGILGTNAIVAGGVAAATGAAWAHAMAGSGGIAVSFLGDGATNQGVIHEAMNMAVLWKIPVVYLIENNLYAVATSVREACAVQRLAQCGVSHGIPGVVVDGMDPVSVYSAVSVARKAGGPVVVEAETYRHRHQAQGLPGSAFGYRTEEEEDAWLRRDPLETYPAALERLGLIDGRLRAELSAEAAAVVDRASAALTESGPAGISVPPRLYPGRGDLLAGVRSAGGELGGLPYLEREKAGPMRVRRFVEVIAETLGRRLDLDPDALILGEEVGHMKGGAFMATADIFRRHRSRVADTPISEAGFVGMSLGLALMGKKPIVEIMYPDFALVAADQLFNQIGKHRYMYGDRSELPIVARTRVGIGSGYGAQHSMEPAALYALFPGWRIVAPSNPFDYIGLFNTAFASRDPVLVIEHQALYPTEGEVPDDRDFCVPFGSARVVRAGTDISVVAYSRMTAIALEAAEKLAAEGVSAEVIDLRSVDYASVDYGTIGASVRKTGRLLIAEEGLLPGGIGAQLAYEVQRRFFDFLDAEIARLGGEAVPMPVSSALERLAVPDADAVAEAMRGLSK
jgi:2-oxoisovalerate dehydrogenase E1 component